MLCINCLSNAGLRSAVARIARPSDTPCPNCGGRGPRLTTTEQVDEVIDRFFVHGSTAPTGSQEPIYNLSSRKLPATHGISFDRTLRDDVELLARYSSGTIFRNAPNTWRMGYTTLEDDLDHAITASPEGAEGDALCTLLDRVIDHCLTVTVSRATEIYRIRCDVAQPFEVDQFDALQNGKPTRFSDGSVPVLYGAFDVETCLHESRIFVEDEIIVATLLPTRCLRVLDLTNVPYDEPEPDVGGEGGDIFYFVNARLLFGSHSAQGHMLARRCQERGLDGIKYPSFFSDLRPGRERFPNIALFGQPIHNGVVELQSLNNIRLDTVRYEFTYGPVTQRPSKQDLQDLKALIDQDWTTESQRAITQGFAEIFARSEPRE